MASSFECKPNKYRLVQTEERQAGKKLKDIQFGLKSDLPSKLPEYVQDFMKELVSSGIVSRYCKLVLKYTLICNTLVPKLSLDCKYFQI